MSRTLTAHVSLWDEAGKVVILAPGDELPEWAEGRVGDHCLALAPIEEASDETEGGKEVTPDESDTEDEAGDPEDKPAGKPQAAAPDFTGSAPRRRQSRK